MSLWTCYKTYYTIIFFKCLDGKVALHYQVLDTDYNLHSGVAYRTKMLGFWRPSSRLFISKVSVIMLNDYKQLF